MILSLNYDERKVIIELCSVGFQSCGTTLQDCDLTDDEVNILLCRICSYGNILRKLVER